MRVIWYSQFKSKSSAKPCGGDTTASDVLASCVTKSSAATLLTFLRGANLDVGDGFIMTDINSLKDAKNSSHYGDVA